MYYYVTELQNRPDGQVNNSITGRSSLATGLSLWYQRAAAAVTNTDFTSVALMLQDQHGHVVKNEEFGTQYVAPETEGEDNSPEESQSLFSN